ncbi:MAG: tetratricopeptide repeat protein [Synechococcaceae cyanobacterium RM1_1_27]|nr:tetratricopeptide repeat protein [Synechococcaceae cyanobacterium RM1_1_27]
MAAKGFGTRPHLESPLQQAQQALIQGNWEQAESQLQALVTTRRLDPVEQGIAHDLQGQLAMVRGDLAAALVQFQQAIICQPQSALFHAHLGILLRRRGERERALSILERAIKLDPKEMEAQAALGGSAASPRDPRSGDWALSGGLRAGNRGSRSALSVGPVLLEAGADRGGDSLV